MVENWYSPPLSEQNSRPLYQQVKASPPPAAEMELAPYSTVYRSIIVHKNDVVPIQLGCRFINSALALHFINQNFTLLTISDSLLSLASTIMVEHIVETRTPETWIRDLLEINGPKP